MAKKGKTNIIQLESTEGTGVQYATVKNTQNTKERMVLKKYDKKLRRHVEFKESKK